MSIGFMITNGGPHPPEKWADVTARAITDLIVIEQTAPTQAIVDKREFEMALFKMLIDLHKGVQETARNALKETHHASHSAIAAHYATDTTDKIIALAQGTRFAEHFRKAEVQGFLRNVTGQHFANSVDIEHRWHKDRNRKG